MGFRNTFARRALPSSFPAHGTRNGNPRKYADARYTHAQIHLLGPLYG